MKSIEIGVSYMEKVQAKARAEDDLLTWTIYDHPSDFPNDYVVRPSSMKLATPLTVHFKRAQLEHVRLALQHIGCVRLERSPEDDPAILETWV